MSTSSTGPQSDEPNTPSSRSPRNRGIFGRFSRRTPESAAPPPVRTPAPGTALMVKPPAPVSTHTAPVPIARRVRGASRTLGVMTFSGALVATLALPAYAFVAPTPGVEAHGEVLSALNESDSQNVTVDDDAEAAEAVREEFDATTMEELRQKRLAEERERRLREQRAAEAAAAVQYAASGSSGGSSSSGSSKSSKSSGSSGGSYTSKSPRSAVVSIAKQYLGVPYVYGGRTPAGFDCSGFTMYVYNKIGIKLPHSSSRQGAMGTRIPASQAAPGDLIILEGGGHVAIYVGGGKMIHAPFPGRSVEIIKIYSPNHYFVRI